MASKLDRIYEQTECNCIKASYRILNIRAIYRGEDPPYGGASVNRCPTHGPAPHRPQEGTDGDGS